MWRANTLRSKVFENSIPPVSKSELHLPHDVLLSHPLSRHAWAPLMAMCTTYYQQLRSGKQKLVSSNISCSGLNARNLESDHVLLLNFQYWQSPLSKKVVSTIIMFASPKPAWPKAKSHRKHIQKLIVDASNQWHLYFRVDLCHTYFHGSLYSTKYIKGQDSLTPSCPIIPR